MRERPLRRHAVAAAILAAVAMGSTGVVAWEEDLHYGLTFWLATQAGFSRNDADEIARGDQSYDDSEHTSAIPTVLWIVLSSDTGAARDLQPAAVVRALCAARAGLSVSFLAAAIFRSYVRFARASA